MEHIADVGLVNAHAEGNRGHHDHAGAGHELVLVFVALGCAHASVIRQRGNAGFGEVFGHLLGVFARETVDDAVLPFAISRKLDYAIPSRLLAQIDFHAEMDVGAVKACYEQLPPPPEKLLHDVVAGRLVGCGCESPDGHIGQMSSYLRQSFVFGAERRPPL